MTTIVTTRVNKRTARMIHKLERTNNIFSRLLGVPDSVSAELTDAGGGHEGLTAECGE